MPFRPSSLASHGPGVGVWVGSTPRAEIDPISIFKTKKAFITRQWDVGRQEYMRMV